MIDLSKDLPTSELQRREEIDLSLCHEEPLDSFGLLPEFEEPIANCVGPMEAITGSTLLDASNEELVSIDGLTVDRDCVSAGLDREDLAPLSLLSSDEQDYDELLIVEDSSYRLVDDSLDQFDSGTGSAWESLLFDELEDNEVEEAKPSSAERVTREVRAAQKANEFALEHNLDDQMEDLVAEVFAEWGWGTAKRALSTVVKAGLVHDELELAILLRKLWASDEIFWQSILSKWSRPALSWNVATSLARIFNAYPQWEELEHWLYEARIRWGESNILQNEYPTFHEFVLMSVSSRFNEESVCPGASLVEAGFYENYEDEFTCGSYFGRAPVALGYERAFTMNRY